MSTTPQKTRFYKQDYLKFHFIENESNKAEPKCVLCDKTLSNEAMKPSRLKDHFKRVHSEHADKRFSENVEMRK